MLILYEFKNLNKKNIHTQSSQLNFFKGYYLWAYS